MLSRVLTAALAAGFMAAVVATVLQAFATTPLILKAEVYEAQASSGHREATLVLAHVHEAPGSEAKTDEWKPDGVSRLAFTGLATLVASVGYALLLLALMLAAGAEMGPGSALAWGIGGFLAANLAPAMGLPPELPGMGGEHLAARQAWWLMTAVATGAGVYLAAAVRSPVAIALGLAAIVAPHAIGAPQGAGGGEVPAVLAAQFAARSLAVAFVFWAVLGLSLGWIWPRLAAEPEVQA